MGVGGRMACERGGLGPQGGRVTASHRRQRGSDQEQVRGCEREEEQSLDQEASQIALSDLGLSLVKSQ